MGIRVGVLVGTGDGENVEVGIAVSVDGINVAAGTAGAQETKAMVKSKTVMNTSFFIYTFILQGTAQRIKD